MKKEALLILINASIALTATLILVLFHIAPYFTINLLIICLISFLFILTESWFTHHAAEFENRFWTLIAFFLGCVVFFTPDSPIRTLTALTHPQAQSEPSSSSAASASSSTGIFWCIVCFFTYLAHNYDRHLRRLSLTTPPYTRSPCPLPSLAIIGDSLKVIDMKWFSSTLMNVFFLPMVLRAEAEVIGILKEATAEELNLLLNAMELPLLVYKIKDHRIAGRFHRTQLLDLLCRERISELSVPSKAILLDALQKLRLTAHPLSDVYVKSIFLSTRTDDLSELKCLMDCKGDVNSMHKLIYQDIRSQAIRRDLLAYMAKQAEIQAAHGLIGSKTAKRRNKLAWRKILSDVDDTLSCSGGSWPAGVDMSYPKKALYPGVLAFYRELDIGTNSMPEEIRGNLVFLSARPHVYKDVSESVTYNKFATLRNTRGLYTSPSLLAGSLDTGSAYMLLNDLEPLAMKKFSNYSEYLALYPEFTVVFIGDNGQGDVRTAEMVFSSPKGDSLQRVYIHIVQDLSQTHISNKSFLSNPRVCFFNTYIDAAVDAAANHLISYEGLRRVCCSAREDMALIDWASTVKGKNSKKKWQFALFSGGKKKKKRPPEDKLKQFLRIHELNNSMISANAILTARGLAPVELLAYPQLLQMGDLVRSEFGVGIVSGFRTEDGMYTVSVNNMKLYIFGAMITS